MRRTIDSLPGFESLSRRGFVLGAASAAATVGGLTASGRARAATPKRGGTLRQALRGGATGDSLDGQTLQAAHPISVSWQVRNNLTEIAPDGSITGELAESWDASDDAKKWVIKLRKGVEFHNGKTLDAEDVVHSINQHRGEDTKSAAASIMSDVTDVKADGPDTVIFQMGNGNADFPYLLADYHLTIGIAGTTGQEWDQGIGTGPFTLQQWEPGVRAITERNPNYFKEGLPYFDSVETLHIADATARQNALQGRSVDVIEEPDLKTIKLMKRVPNLKVLETAGMRHFPYPMLSTEAPFDNKDVQMALKLSIDREQWVSKILSGHGYVGNDHPVGRNQQFYAAELEQRTYDPDKAKFHLKQAGLSDLTVTLTAADVYSGGVDGAVLFAENARSRGITINIERRPTDGYWNDVPLARPWHVSSLGGRVTVDWVMSVSYAADAPWNDSKWTHDRFNTLLREARVELDAARRAEMYFEMQKIVSDECPTVIPAFANNIVATNDQVQTPEKIGGDFQLDGMRNHERWWFG